MENEQNEALVYLYYKYNSDVTKLIKELSFQRFNGESWCITEDDWKTQIKPWFDQNKCHYDLAKVDIKYKIPIKDCSQKYPVYLHSTDSNFYVTGGITESCRNHLATIAYWNKEVQGFMGNISKFDDFKHYCTVSKIKFEEPNEIKHSNMAYVWCEGNKGYIKGDFDCKQLVLDVPALTKSSDKSNATTTVYSFQVAALPNVLKFLNENRIKYN